MDNFQSLDDLPIVWFSWSQLLWQSVYTILRRVQLDSVGYMNVSSPWLYPHIIQCYTKWGPRTIAKLVYNSNNYGLWYANNYSFHGVHKPTYNVWGPHIDVPFMEPRFSPGARYDEAPRVRWKFLEDHFPKSQDVYPLVI